MSNPNKGLRTTNRQQIQELPWGMWVWECADGLILANENGDIMHVFCSDREPLRMQAAKQALTDAAYHYGYGDGGRAVFWSGKRPISDEELQSQLDRASAGLIPDPLDIGAIREEMEGIRHERQTRN